MTDTYHYSDDEDEYNYEYHENDSSDNQSKNQIQLNNSDETQYFQVNNVNIFNVMTEFISKIAYTFDISIDSATLLLIDMKWNEDKIYERLNMEPDLIERYNQFKPLEHKKLEPFKDNFYCFICSDEKNDITSLSCGHVFCTDCFSGYINSKKGDKNECFHSRCLMTDCKHRMLPSFFELYGSKETYHDYKNFLISDYMDNRKGMQYCRGHQCNRVFIREDMISLMNTIEGDIEKCKNVCNDIFVECKNCKNRQCFCCNNEDHYPITCEQLNLWMEKDRNEGLTMNWIVANTKKCPECRNPIEKNQGCRHMKCKYCNHDFCWDCMHKWNLNCGYDKPCNGKVREGYESELDMKIKNEAAKELHYYLSNYQIYMKQKDAINFAKKLKSTISVKIDEWKIIKEEVSETGDFLIESIDSVIWARNILKNCVIWKFFTIDQNKKNLINLYYDDLIIQTELLTSFIEKNVVDMNKTNILNTNNILKNSIYSIKDVFKSLD